MSGQKDYKLPCLLDFYGALLTDKQHGAIEMYYNEDLSLAEIAEEYNTSRQAVHENIKRCESKLYELESQLRLYEKYSGIASDIKNIENLINDIIEIDKQEKNNNNIEKNCREILNIITNIKL